MCVKNKDKDKDKDKDKEKDKDKDKDENLRIAIEAMNSIGFQLEKQWFLIESMNCIGRVNRKP